MVDIDFYYLPASAPCSAVFMAAKTLGIRFNKKPLSLKNGDHLKPEFLKLNPQHTVPTLVDNGFVLWESRAIMIYLVEEYGNTDTIYPKCPKKQAVVNQRLFFDMQLYSAFGDYYYPQKKEKKPADPELLKKLETTLGFLNTFLKEGRFVAGPDVTIADFATIATIGTMDAVGINLRQFPYIFKWYQFCKGILPGWDIAWAGCLEFAKYFD